MRSRFRSFSFSPQLPTYASVAALATALFLGLVRFLLIDRSDPIHCEALATSGRWSGHGFKNWQPDGCMMHSYRAADAETCLDRRTAVFIGDSVTRKLFFQFANILDSRLPTTVPDDDQKHADHHLRSASGTELSFFWDPFLNSSHVDALTARLSASPRSRPAVLVIGTGLWYLRYASSSGGMPAWEAKMKVVLDAISQAATRPADQIFVLPIEDVVETKLSPERAATMLGSDRDAMNSDLYFRIHPDRPSYLDYLQPRRPSVPITLPTVFNAMLDPSQTEDGLHFSDPVVRMQANILFNSHCNDRLPKAFPMDKTCCRSYPRPTILHAIVLAAIVLWGPYTLLLSRRYGYRSPSAPLVAEDQLPSLVISGALALVYLADRTGFWLKEQKSFDSWAFTAVNLICLAVGLGTVKQADKDLGFLNREQTDEWKGWMQVAILIYHYYGASKISGIYNSIRVLVAAYLFMTGYGHTSFYLKKADFGFTRVAQIVVRINLFTLFLAYVMNADYIGYYFSPLVTMWYFIIYGTMYAGHQYNDRAVFVVLKIAGSMALVTWFMSQPYLLTGLFDVLERFCGIHWSAREWAFRVNLDLWIVYVGMAVAVLVIKIGQHRLTDHPQWTLVSKAATVLSGFVMLWFFGFELTQPDKFAYNAWHPYISFLPVLAFVVLRNANAILRSASSRAFAFIGRCSLETFIIQYHLWLAADTKGILIVLPWTRWRSLNMLVTAVMFVFVSHHVSNATSELTKWICGTTARKGLPSTNADLTSSSRHDRNAAPTIELQQPSPIQPKDDEAAHLVEPPTPRRQRWVDRLAEGPSTPPNAPPSPGLRVWYGDTEWQPGGGVKVAIGLGAMWVLNMLWSYPPPPPPHP
ncbi:unnamed protein product [Peniophora sp. CBMAI 1063]|nr:unnamed protein product [Peniophora sp. CBMAI 1063]